MPTRVRLFRIAGLALSLALIAGCTEHARPPVRNHAPKQAYLITLTVENPPAPVTAIEGHASYQVMNDGDCLPRRPFFGGPAGIRSITEPVRFLAVGPNVWQGTIYADLYLDQSQTDALGACDWTLIAAGADFRMRNATFASTLSAQEIHSEQERIEYFNRHWLEVPPPKGARISRMVNVPDDRSATFPVTITTRKMRHD